MTQVQTELGSLSSTVSGLSTALTTLQSSADGIEAQTDYSSDLGALASGLAIAQTSIDSLTAQLENFDGNDAQLNTISSNLIQIAADVKELLGNSSVVNSDIIITNKAQLILAESLVDTRTYAPNVIVNGEVEVEFNNTNFTAYKKKSAKCIKQSRYNRRTRFNPEQLCFTHHGNDLTQPYFCRWECIHQY